MNRADLIAALDLPPGSRVDQRVPKKLLLEHAPTPADRRRINEGIDEVQWLAALKPATVGVPLYRDDVRRSRDEERAIRGRSASHGEGEDRLWKSAFPGAGGAGSAGGVSGGAVGGGGACGFVAASAYGTAA